MFVPAKEDARSTQHSQIVLLNSHWTPWGRAWGPMYGLLMPGPKFKTKSQVHWWFTWEIGCIIIPSHLNSKNGFCHDLSDILLCWAQWASFSSRSFEGDHILSSVPLLRTSLSTSGNMQLSGYSRQLRSMHALLISTWDAPNEQFDNVWKFDPSTCWVFWFVNIKAWRYWTRNIEAKVHLWLQPKQTLSCAVNHAPCLPHAQSTSK